MADSETPAVATPAPAASEGVDPRYARSLPSMTDGYKPKVALTVQDDKKPPPPAPPAEAPAEPATPAPAAEATTQTPIAEPPPPAATPPDDPAAKAQELLELAKKDPNEFLRKHGGPDPFANRLNQLAEQAKQHRERDGVLKTREAAVARAEALEKELEQDPIAFLEKRGGRELFDRWARRILGEPDAARGGGADTTSKLLERFDRLEKKVDEVATAPRQQRAQEDWATIATEYLGGVRGAMAQPDFKSVASFYTEAEVVARVQEMVSAHTARYAQALGRELDPAEARLALSELTPAHALGIIAAELKERLRKSGVETPTAGKSEPATKPQPSPETIPSGPKSLTNDVAKDVARQHPEDEERLPDRVRLRRIAAKYQGR